MLKTPLFIISFRQALRKPLSPRAMIVVPSLAAVLGSIVVLALFHTQLAPETSNAEAREPTMRCSSAAEVNPCENVRAGVWGDWLSTQTDQAWVEYQYDQPMRITAVKIIDQGSATNEILEGTLDFDNNSANRRSLADFGIATLSHQQTPIISINPAVTAKTVRFTATSVRGSSPVGLAEFRVYAQPIPQPPKEPTPPPAPPSDDGAGVFNVTLEVRSKTPLEFTLIKLERDAKGVVSEPVKNAVFTHTAQLVSADGSVLSSTPFTLPSRTIFRWDPKNKNKIISETVDLHLPFTVPLKNAATKKRIRIVDYTSTREVASFDAAQNTAPSP